MLLVCAGTSRAGLIFFDDFDSYTYGLNWPGEGNWTVSLPVDGTVDMIGAGGYWDLIPGNGLYLDMDGSTGNAGKITSIPLSLAPGEYVLDFDFAGNQRGGGFDEMIVQVGGGSLLDFILGASDGIPLTTFTSAFPGFSTFTVASAT
jgi:hypothetical protein